MGKNKKLAEKKTPQISKSKKKLQNIAVKNIRKI